MPLTKAPLWGRGSKVCGGAELFDLPLAMSYQTTISDILAKHYSTLETQIISLN